MNKKFSKRYVNKTKFNIPLYQLRESKGMTQKEFGELLGVCGQTINRDENGYDYGNLGFWKRVQNEFDIPDEKMWAYQNGTCTLENMVQSKGG